MTDVSFRLGVTPDFLKANGDLGWGDIGLAILDGEEHVEWEFLSSANSDEIMPEVARDYDALLVLGSRVTSSTLSMVDRLALVARFGVGYDSIDTGACSRSGVALTITPDGVRRPVALAALTMLLALAHRLLLKDRLTRLGRWEDKLEYMGLSVTGRTLGIVGFGNIGRELVRLARVLDLRFLASDPYVSAEEAQALGTELVPLDRLLQESDFVCVTCKLTEDTRHLIGANELRMMKASAFLVNVARGEIVDQAALTDALKQDEILGAGLDVFETEPVPGDEELLTLDNVIVTPHALCWTDECALGNGRSALQSIIDVSHGEVPSNVVNGDVLQDARFLERLNRFKQAGVRSCRS